ncbi:hypothetical protein ACA910_001135 [Epithemia clementina (nom. ined.)]
MARLLNVFSKTTTTSKATKKNAKSNSNDKNSTSNSKGAPSTTNNDSQNNPSSLSFVTQSPPPPASKPRPPIPTNARVRRKTMPSQPVSLAPQALTTAAITTATRSTATTATKPPLTATASFERSLSRTLSPSMPLSGDGGPDSSLPPDEELERALLHVLEQNIPEDVTVSRILNLLYKTNGDSSVGNNVSVNRDLVQNLYEMSQSACVRLDDQAKCLALTFYDLGLLENNDDNGNSNSVNANAVAATVPAPVPAAPDPSAASSSGSIRLHHMLTELSFGTLLEELDRNAAAEEGEESPWTQAPQSPSPDPAEQEPQGQLLLPDEYVIACPVCMEEFSESQTMSFYCSYDVQVDGLAHSLCRECAFQYVQSQAINNNGDHNSTTTATTPLTCFQSGCTHELLPHELALILGRGNFKVGLHHPLYRQLDLQQRDAAIAKHPQDYVHCPTPTCSWIAARSHHGAQDCVTCPQCFCKFCSNCTDQYHYRCTCLEYQSIQRAWHDWKSHGQSEYWQTQERRTEDSNPQALADAAKRERQRVRRVRKIEHADEHYKAKHCRHCPHCDRLVERTEGCSIMYCGRDAHDYQLADGTFTNNRQRGCGQRFDWSLAQPYRPVAVGKRIHYNVAALLQDDYNAQWLPQAEHERCDCCSGTNLRGLLFECVNCPCFNVCEACDKDGKVNKVHDPEHVFIIHPPKRKPQQQQQQQQQLEEQRQSGRR